MIILGIDPGLQKTGWGVIDAYGSKLSYISCGTIYSNSKEPIANRLYSIGSGVREVVELYKPEACAVEETFLNKNPMSSLKLGHARGAIIMSLALSGVPIFEYAATLVKKSVVGVGRADKEQVQMMVKCLMPTADFKTEDAADALAVAVCHNSHAASAKLMSGA